MPDWQENHTPASAMQAGIFYYDRQIAVAEKRLSELQDWVEQKQQEIAGLKFTRASWVDAKERLLGDG